MGGEIFDMHWERFWQKDIALLAADEFFNPLLAPAIGAAKHRLGKAEWFIDTHAAMAEGALLRGEQTAHRRVVHIDGEIIWKHEFDAAQRISLAGGLAHHEMTGAGKNLIAEAAKITRIAGSLRQYLLAQD